MMKHRCNIDIIYELERFFENDNNIYSKIKLIEFYLYSNNIQECINKYNAFLKDSKMDYEYMKPSRITTLIKAFENGFEKSGYIQPIGKRLFLKKFLDKFPSPRFVHLGEEEWTVALLKEYIKKKYECSITPDTIRKEITKKKKAQKKIGNSAELFYKQKLANLIQKELDNFIYFYQFYETPSPLRKTNKQTNNNRKSTFVGCICGKTKSDKYLSYKRKPYFQISDNFNTHIPNFHYYLNIPNESGLFLVKDNLCARKYIKEFYYYCFCKDNILPRYRLYFLPNDMYDSLQLLNDFKVFAQKTEKILLESGVKGIEEEKNDMDKLPLSFNRLFEYDIKKSNSKEEFEKTPQLLSKKRI